MTALRFGVVSESVRRGRAWLDFARQVEDSGIDVLLLRDHFSAGPFGQQLAPVIVHCVAQNRGTRPRFMRIKTQVLTREGRELRDRLQGERTVSAP